MFISASKIDNPTESNAEFYGFYYSENQHVDLTLVKFSRNFHGIFTEIIRNYALIYALFSE